MSLRFEDVFNDYQLIDYSKALPPQTGALDGLFPTRKVFDMRAEILKSNFNQDTSAQFYPLDVPVKDGQREGFEQGEVALGYIAEKMSLNEQEIFIIENPRNSQERQFYINKMFQDAARIRGRINTRITRLQYEALTTGKINIEDENGFSYQMDFGVPTNHKETYNWSDTKHDIFEDLFKVKEKIQTDTGFVPRYIITSPKWLYTIVKNESVRLQTNGDNYKSRYITPAELNERLVRYELPQIKVDNRTYKERVMKKGKVVDTFVRYFPEDMFVAVPDGILGQTLRGDTPEARGLRNQGIADVEYGDITMVTYKEVNPTRHHIYGSTTAMVTFPYADQVFYGTLN